MIFFINFVIIIESYWKLYTLPFILYLPAFFIYLFIIIIYLFIYFHWFINLFFGIGGEVVQK